jgi:hypothetical protein
MIPSGNVSSALAMLPPNLRKMFHPTNCLRLPSSADWGQESGLET